MGQGFAAQPCGLVEQRGVAYAKTVAEAMNLKLDMEDQQNAEQFLRDRGFGQRMGWGQRPALLVVDFSRSFHLRAQRIAFRRQQSRLFVGWNQSLRCSPNSPVRNFLRFYHYECAQVSGVIKLACFPIRHPNASV